MEFANLVVIFVAGWLVLRRPEKERLAFGLLAVSVRRDGGALFAGHSHVAAAGRELLTLDSWTGGSAWGTSTSTGSSHWRCWP